MPSLPPSLFHCSSSCLPWLIPYSKAAPPSFIDLSESLAACQIQTRKEGRREEEGGRGKDLKQGSKELVASEELRVVDLLHADTYRVARLVRYICVVDKDLGTSTFCQRYRLGCCEIGRNGCALCRQAR